MNNSSNTNSIIHHFGPSASRIGGAQYIGHDPRGYAEVSVGVRGHVKT